MKSIEILALGLRIVGIYGLVVSVQFMFNLYYVLTQFNTGYESVSAINYLYIGVFILLVLTSIAFVKFPVTVAKLLTPKTSNDSAIFNGSIKDLEIVAFTVFGAILVVSSLPDIVNGIYHWWQTSKMQLLGELVGKNEAFIPVLISSINICIGLVLIFRSNSLSNFISRVRGYGVQSS